MNKIVTAVAAGAFSCAASAHADFIFDGARVGESFTHAYLFPDQIGGVDAIAAEILFDGSGLGFQPSALAVTAQPAVGGWGFDGAGGPFALMSGPDLAPNEPGPVGTVGFDVNFAGEADGVLMEALFDLRYRLWAYDDGVAVVGAEWKNFDLVTRPAGSDPARDVDFFGGTLFAPLDLSTAPDFDDIVRTIPAPGAVAPFAIALSTALARRRRPITC